MDKEALRDIIKFYRTLWEDFMWAIIILLAAVLAYFDVCRLGHFIPVDSDFLKTLILDFVYVPITLILSLPIVALVSFIKAWFMQGRGKPNITRERCSFQTENKQKLHQYEKYVGIRFTNNESSDISNVWVKLNKMVFVYEDRKVRTIELNRDNHSFSWRDEKDERIPIAGHGNKVLNIAKENLQHVDFLMYKETSSYFTFWQGGDSEKDGSTNGIFEIEIEINGDYGGKKDFSQKSFWRITYKSPTLPISPSGVTANNRYLAIIDILEIPSIRKPTESNILKEDTYPKFLQKIVKELGKKDGGQ